MYTILTIVIVLDYTLWLHYVYHYHYHYVSVYSFIALPEIRTCVSLNLISADRTVLYVSLNVCQAVDERLAIFL